MKHKQPKIFSEFYIFTASFHFILFYLTSFFFHHRSASSLCLVLFTFSHSQALWACCDWLSLSLSLLSLCPTPFSSFFPPIFSICRRRRRLRFVTLWWAVDVSQPLSHGEEIKPTAPSVIPPPHRLTSDVTSCWEKTGKNLKCDSRSSPRSGWGEEPPQARAVKQ